MFDELLDNDNDDAAAALPPPAVQGRGPGRNNGRRGCYHTPNAKANIRHGWVKNRVRQLESALDTASSRPDFRKHVARTCFGNKSCGPKELQVAGSSIDIGRSALGKRSSEYATSIDYGCYSALQGQSAGIARFIDTAGTSGLISVNAFDDAAMWVKDPAPAADRESGKRSEGSKINGELWRRGKTIHLPVMNLDETLFARRHQIDSDPSFHSCSVHSGSTVLCKANTATVRQAWQDWTAVSPSSSGSGSRIDSHDDISNSLNQSDAWITCCVTKDNLGLNQCIMGLNELDIQNRLDSGLQDESSVTTQLHLNCACHSSVLCTKPMVERMQDLPGQCVRLGHLHESGRVSQSHLDYIESIVSDNFVFQAVAELPAEAEHWRRSTSNVLRASRAGRDLTESDELEIMSIDNGDWDAKQWVHWCLGPQRCRAGPDQSGCGGCPQTAKRFMIAAAKKASGTMKPTPASYRWKGMEEFIAVMYRSRRQHDILLDTHLRIWPPSIVMRAEEELARICDDQGEGPASNDKIIFKSQVRGGRSVKMMQDDPDAKRLEHGLVLQSGIQAYLNKCFAVDAKVSEYTRQLQFPQASNAPEQDGHTLTKLRRECMDRNLHILSGGAGNDVLAHYTHYFNYVHSVWSDWRMDASDKYQVCLDLICVIQEAEYRLVFKMNSPKLCLFEVCKNDTFDITTVRAIAERLLNKNATCKKCIDQTFTLIWLYRLCKMGTAAAHRAWEHLCDLLSVLRVTSTIVERKHLVGQELRVKKRGSGTTCVQVAKQVFRHSVKRAGQRFRDESKFRCLGGGHSKSISRRFHSCLDECLVSGRPDRRAKPDSWQAKAKARKRKQPISNGSCKKRTAAVRGYDVFVEQNFDRTKDGQHTFQKRRQTDAKWRALSDDQRSQYTSVAEVRNQKAAEYDDEDFPEFFRRQAQSAQSSRSVAFKSRRLRAVRNTVKKMIDDPIYSTEPRLHEFDSGFRSELICNDVPLHEVQADLKNIFRYNYVPDSNPKKMPFFETCAQRQGGLCDTDEGFDHADALTHNLYVNSKAWKEQLPVLLQFSTGASSDTHLWLWLGKLVGKGPMAFVTPAVVSLSPYDTTGQVQVAEVLVAANGSGSLIKSKTSHVAFSEFLLRWQRDQGPGVDYHDLKMLQMTRWNFRRDIHASKFRVVLESTHSECNLSCTERLKNSKSSVDSEAPGTTGMFAMAPAKRVAAMMIVRKPATSSARGKPHKRKPRHSSALPSNSDSNGSSSDDSVACHGTDSDEEAQHSMSEEGGSDGADSGGSDSDDGLHDEPWNAIGLKAWDHAPARRNTKAVCLVCEGCFEPGELRMDYRTKISNSLRDQRRFHPRCINRIPDATRKRDLKVLQSWLKAAGLSAKDTEIMQEAMAALKALG